MSPTRRITTSVLFVALATFCTPQLAALTSADWEAAGPLDATSEQVAYYLPPYLRILPAESTDDTTPPSFDAALNAPRLDPGRVYARGVYWLACPFVANLEYPAHRRGPIVLEMPTSESIRVLAVVVAHPDGTLEKPEISNAITLPTGGGQTTPPKAAFQLQNQFGVVWLRAEVEGRPVADFFAYPARVLFYLGKSDNIPMLIMIVATAALLLYNLILYAVHRDVTILVYAGVLASFVGYLAARWQIIAFLVPFSHTWFHGHVEHYFVAAAMALLVVFFMRSLDTKATMPAMHTVLRVALALCGVFAALLTVARRPLDVAIPGVAIEMTVFIILIVAMVGGVVRRKRAAGFFLIGWGAYLVVEFIPLLNTIGLISLPSTLNAYVDLPALFPILLMSISVGDKMNTLSRERAYLARMDQLKTEFFYNVSHELRTPLQLIGAPIGDVIAGTYGRSLTADHPVFATVKRNADRLERLVRQILDFHRTEHASLLELHPQVVDPVSLVRSYCDQAGPSARSRGIVLRYVEDVREGTAVDVDIDLFEKAFFNLLSNAFKAIGRDGAVDVEVREDVSGATVLVSVTDTGPGLTADQIEVVFERYRRLDHGAPGLGGFGIGLSIVKSAIERMGGNVEATSTHGKGATFTIRLPAVRGAATGTAEVVPASRADAYIASATTAAIPPPSFDPLRKMILVVEDTPDLLSYLAERFGSDYNVLPATDGGEALHHIQEGNLPDLVVSDLLMPNVDGRRLLQIIRTDPRLAGVPFVFLTAVSSEEQRLHSYRDGAVDYVVKPFPFEELAAKVASLLEVADRAPRSSATEAEKPTASLDAICSRFAITKRERQVLSSLMQGLANREIASALRISARTVDRHVESIFNKTGTNSRFQLRRLLESCCPEVFSAVPRRLGKA